MVEAVFSGRLHGLIYKNVPFQAVPLLAFMLLYATDIQPPQFVSLAGINLVGLYWETGVKGCIVYICMYVLSLKLSYCIVLLYVYHVNERYRKCILFRVKASIYYTPL